MSMSMMMGVREVVDLVFKAKADMKIGNICFKAGDPVWYFTTAKTSGLEGGSTQTYATGKKYKYILDLYKRIKIYFNSNKLLV